STYLFRILRFAIGLEQRHQPSITATQSRSKLRVPRFGDEFFVDRHRFPVGLLRFLRALGLFQQRPQEVVVGEAEFLLIDRLLRKITGQFLVYGRGLAIGSLGLLRLRKRGAGSA